MDRSTTRIAVSLGLYALLAVAPLAVAAAGAPGPGRGFWVEFGCGLGFVGLAMMGLQFVLTARFHAVAAPFGQDVMLRFHREAGLVAAAFIVAHPALCLIAHPGYAEFFDPRVNLPRAGALSAVLVFLALLVVLPLVRRRVGIPYEWWRLTHGLLAFAVIGIGLAHTLMVGHVVSTLWKQAFWVAMTGAAMGLLVHVRVVKPLAMLRRPYRIAGVRREADRVWTLALEAHGHDGMAFEPGQFVGLTIGPTPFAVRQHPFSIASSAAQRGRIELTIKEFGDFTSTIKRVPVGARAFLEGPYGSFTIDRADDSSLVLIVGGIGITPAMSILRTLRDAGDRRAVVLVYATATLENAPFRDELAAMAGEINLRIIHLLERPPEGWDGERGFLTREMLDRLVPGEGRERLLCLLCGPPPMMDLAERLLTELGVPPGHILSERFDIV